MKTFLFEKIECCILIPPFEKGGLGGICIFQCQGFFENPPQSPFFKGGSSYKIGVERGLL